MELPVVLVLSHGAETIPADIIYNIRNLPATDNQKIIENTTAYIYKIETKYYTTDILLIPVDDFADLPKDCRESTEGILIYFDANNRDFLQQLPKYVDFVKTNQIDFCVLLCHELTDEKDGVTFKELKSCYKMFDLIELGKKLEEDEEIDPFNPIGYKELEQAMKSVIWSNVELSEVSRNVDVDIEDHSNLSEQDIENELENFESLLSSVMQFRPNTSNLSRNERLDYAQGFAEVFEKLINMDDESKNDELAKPDKHFD